MPTDRPLRIAGLVDFLELRPFTAAWTDLGLTDDDLAALEAQILAGPPGPVVRGTGGLRKLRVAPARWGTGKRGALRVAYAHFPVYRVVALVGIYAKSARDDMSAAQKHGYRQVLARIETSLARKQGKRP